MKMSRLLLAGLALMAIACHHEVTEADIVGTYTTDPEHVNTNDIEKKMSITFSADHNFILKSGTPVDVEGTWNIDTDSKKVALTPATLDVTNPQNGQKTKMPMSQALQMMRASGADQKMIDGLDQISREAYFEPMEDGKKLYENGKPTLIKSGS